MHDGVKHFLTDISLDIIGGSIDIIESHDFIQPNIKIKSWYGFICNKCGYSLNDVCFVNWETWSPITCDEAKIKRALE